MRKATYFNIPEEERLETLSFEGKQQKLKCSHTNVINYLLNINSENEEQDSLVMIPYFKDRSTLFSILKSNFPDLKKPTPDLACGDIISLEEGKRDCEIIKIDDNKEVLLFVYGHVMKRRPKSNANMDRSMMSLFSNIAQLLKERNFKKLLIPVFGSNNGFPFSTISLILYDALCSCIQEGIFENTSLEVIEVCAPEGFPATRTIEHLSRLFFLKKNENQKLSWMSCPTP